MIGLFIVCTTSSANSGSPTIDITAIDQREFHGYYNDGKGLYFLLDAIKVYREDGQVSARLYFRYRLPGMEDVQESSWCDLPADAVLIGPSGNATLNTEPFLPRDCEAPNGEPVPLPQINLTTEPSEDARSYRGHVNAIEQWMEGDATSRVSFQARFDEFTTRASGTFANLPLDPLVKKQSFRVSRIYNIYRHRIQP